MRIVQIISSGKELYGAQNHVLTICKFLMEKRHEVYLVTGTGGQLTNEAAKIGVKVVLLPNLKRNLSPLTDLKCLSDLRILLRDINPDIIASHSSKAGILSRLLAYQLQIPNTFTVHGWSFADGMSFTNRLLFKVIERLIGKISDRIILLSQADRAIGLKNKIAPNEKFEVIHLGIDNLPPVKQEEILEQNTAKFTMVMSARFSNQKDHQTLLKSLKNLNNDNWRLFLLGDGPDIDNVREMCSEFLLDNCVHFIGMSSNVRAFIEASDLVLLITNWEGFPISILEAMSLGKPIIATKIAGIPEQITNGVNGYLVERKDHKQITQYISELIDNPALVKEMGRESKRTFESLFTSAEMLRRTTEIYVSMVDKHIKRNSI